MQLLLFLLAACIPPSTLGLLTDGALPVDGQSRLMAHGGGLVDQDDGVLEAAVVGLGYERGLGDRRSLFVGVTVLVPPDDSFLVHSELRRRLTHTDRRLQILLLGGSGVTLSGWGLYAGGFHLGGMGSVELGEHWHLYGGLKTNPTIVPASFNVDGLACGGTIEMSPCFVDLWGLHTSLPLGTTLALERLRFGLEVRPTLLWGADGDYGLSTSWYGGLQGYASWTF